MARLKEILFLKEADEAAPEEQELSLDSEELDVDGTEDQLDDTETDISSEEESDDDVADSDGEQNQEELENVEPIDALNDKIEEMIGLTEIQHTSSSTILDFEDGGQIMYIQPVVSLHTETIQKIIEIINDDVTKAYATTLDEITGKKISTTRYWKSISTLISTMVRSQLTKSDNLDGLVDEIKQVFKILEIK